MMKRLLSGLCALALLTPAALLAQAVAPQSSHQAKPAREAAAPAAVGVNDYSAAERLLLMTPQLGGLKAGASLSYRFIQRGSKEPAFSEAVQMKLTALPSGGCCAAQAQFLSGENKVELPDVEKPEGNPITLYFLEHDIRDLNRQTKGSVQYFRKRIRMALYEGAQLRDVQLAYRGQVIQGREIILTPFVNDPNKARFEQWTNKRYRFVLSHQVPGHIARITTTVAGPAGAAALYEHDLLLDGVGAEEAPRT